MRLKYLELQGFKTFCNKTRLQFNDGISVVVGPNGSGKSNISDAMRWVLGEQSIKNIRCMKLEDVIFAGSESKRPHGFASVTLVFDNQNRKLVYSEDEVSITRRYYRSGESEYFINMKPVRLKDINELFMDTGVGKDGYSIVGQGKISSIVSAKPIERREIFEEAAGISGCRYRKEDAEHKLKQASENLVRVKDILSELETRIGPLKKQSEKAKLYLKYTEEKKDIEIGLWLDSLEKSKLSMEEYRGKLNFLKEQKEGISKKVSKVEIDIENTVSESNLCLAEIDNLRRFLCTVDEQISEGKNKISLLNSDIGHNNETIDKSDAEISEIETVLKDLENNLMFKNNIYELKKEDIKSKKDEIERFEDKLKENENQMSGHKDGGEQVTKEIDLLDKDRRKKDLDRLLLENSIKEFEIRKENIKNSILIKKDKLEKANKTVDNKKQKFNDIFKKLDSVSDKYSKISLDIQNKKVEYSKSLELLQNINLDIENHRRKIKLLEDFESHMEGFSNSVRSVMKESKLGSLKGIIGPVSSIIRTTSEYSIAIDVALGMAAQNIITVSEGDAKQAIYFLKNNKFGRATFLPISSIKGNKISTNELIGNLGIKGIACDLCECLDEYKGILNYLLGRIVIVDNLDNAVYISKKFSSRFKIVTMDGQVINSGGSLTGGSISGRTGFMSRVSEINELKDITKTLENKRFNYKIIVDSLNEDLEKQENLINKYKSEISEFSSMKNDLSIQMSIIKSEKESDEKVLIELYNQKQYLIDKIDNNKKQILNYIKSIDVLDSKIKDLKSRYGKMKAINDKFLEQNQNINNKIPELKIEHVSLEKEMELINLEMLSIKRSKEEKKQRIKILSEENSRLKNINEAAFNDVNLLDLKIKELHKKKVDSEKKINSLKVKREELEKLSSLLRKEEKDISNENEIIIKELSRLEEKGINIQKEYDEIIAKLWDEYGMTLGEAKENYSKLRDINDSKKRLILLKSNIKNLGEVSVSSIEEYKEVNKRYIFMSSQVEDIEKSRKELTNVINGLDKDMKKIFLDKFEEINKNFSNILNELFGGGFGKLTLENSDDILTSGINISVRIPGKNEIHLEALSGGEKSLVAIALYFAIMKVNPPPFCVLDEIEAALDDVNVDRFASYLRKICAKTQLIIITHRRGTMEEADVLYGVTMVQEGVSSLLELKVSEIMDKVLSV